MVFLLIRRFGSPVTHGMKWLYEIESEINNPGDRLRTVNFTDVMWIGSGFKIFTNDSFWMDATDFKFGQRCSFDRDTTTWVFENISIGDDFLTTGQLYLNAGPHEIEILWPKCSSIKIDSRVWVGARATIVAGAEIGDDVLIGAGSTVRCVIPNNCFAVGSPACPIRSICNGPTAMWS